MRQYEDVSEGRGQANAPRRRRCAAVCVIYQRLRGAQCEAGPRRSLLTRGPSGRQPAPRPTFANLLIYGASACFLCFSLKPFPIFLGFICILGGSCFLRIPGNKSFCSVSYTHIGHGLADWDNCLERPRRNARRKEIIFLYDLWMLRANIQFEQQETASSAATATPQRSVPPPPDPRASQPPPALPLATFVNMSRTE